MSLSEDPRFRISAKQNSKNFWQFDGTAEYKSEKISMDAKPGQDVVKTHLGLRLLSLIKETEKAFRDDGRKIVGDETK